MEMSDLAFSMAMRDIMNSLVQEAIDTQRPRYRYATVVSVDNRTTGKCSVTYIGEQSVVQVSMPGPQPVSVGQVVRIEGIGTDKFITAVIGQEWSQFQDVMRVMGA